MDDPSDERALSEVSQFSGLPVRAMIAPPSDIRSAIRAYYGAGMETSSLSEAVAEINAEAARLQPPPAVTEAPPVAAPARRVSSPPAGASPSADEGPDSYPQIEAHEIPLPRRGKGPRMVTLTLLDGTKVNLPAKSSAPAKKRAPTDPPAPEPAAPAAEGLTARDLVAALRALSHGADATEILGENVRWEALFSALLSLLLKKHVIADWEFVEEYKRV
jgi:type IV pilus assembly protein PilB